MANETKVKPIVKRGNIEVYAGKVVGVYEGKGNAAGNLKNLCLTVRYFEGGENKYENIFIPFWANESFNAMEMLEKASLKKGQFIVVSTFRGKNGSLSGNRIIKGSGIINIPKSEENEYDTNVLMGAVVNTKKNEDHGVTNVNLLVNGKVADGKYDTINAQIAFWNTDNKKTADNAAKLLSEKDGKYPRIVAVTGEQEEITSFTRKNGETGYGTTFKGNSYFLFVPKEKESDESSSPVQEPSQEDEFVNIPDGIEDGLPFGDELPPFMQ